MATLESLRLSGWKSIKETDPPITFGRLNVLVGANGAGKSNLVSYFKLLSQLTKRRLQGFIGSCGGADTLLHFGIKHTKDISSDIQFQTTEGLLQYKCLLEVVPPNDRFALAEEDVKYLSVDGKILNQWTWQGASESRLPDIHVTNKTGQSEFQDLLKNCQPYHFHDTTETAAVRRSGYIDDNRRLNSDAGNLAAMLYLYKQTRPVVYRRILGVVKQVAPVIEDFVLEPSRLNLKNNQLDWRAKNYDYLLGPHQLSDGTLRMIALAALLLQPEEDLPPFIVLDEPELGLHPAAIGILAGLLKQASQHVQVLVATQSVTLLDHFEAEDVIVVDCKDGVSTFRRLDPEPYREWVAEFGLGDLWERNVIGGGPYS